MPKVNKKAKQVETNDALEQTIKLSDNLKLQINVFAREEDDEKTVYVNLRKFYRTQKDRTWKPGRQGLTIPMELAKKLRVKFKAVCEAAEEDPDSIPVIGGADE